MATITWDSTQNDSAIVPGNGSWNTSDDNWTQNGGVNNVLFSNGDDVIFTGGFTTADITLTENIAVGSLTVTQDFQAVTTFNFFSSLFTFTAGASITLTPIGNGIVSARFNNVVLANADLTITSGGASGNSNSAVFNNNVTVAGLLTVDGASNTHVIMEEDANIGALSISSTATVTARSALNVANAVTMVAAADLTVSNFLATFGSFDMDGGTADFDMGLSVTNAVDVSGFGTSVTVVGGFDADTLSIDSADWSNEGGADIVGGLTVENGGSFTNTDGLSNVGDVTILNGGDVSFTGNAALGAVDGFGPGSFSVGQGGSTGDIVIGGGMDLTLATAQTGNITFSGGGDFDIVAGGFVEEIYGLELGDVGNVTFRGTATILLNDLNSNGNVSIEGAGSRLYGTVTLGADGDFEINGSHQVGEDTAVAGGFRDNDVTINGSIDGDVLLGAGADSFLITGAVGKGTLDMEEGADVASIFTNWFGDVLMGNGDDTVTLGSQVQVTGLLDLGNGNDTVTGSDLSDTLNGGEGADVIFGNFGDDVLTMGAGADRAFADAGDDTVFGGSGNDDLRGVGGADVIRGGSDADMVMGGSGQDSLFGDGGADELFGGQGVDRVAGNNGSDMLTGGRGNDELFGGQGADTLNGGFDADTLTGGSGNDIFVFTGAGQITSTAGNDRITDFSGNDLIDLSAVDAQQSVAGNQSFTLVAGFSGTRGELITLTGGGITQVQGDRDGDALADFVLELTGEMTLDVSDFVL